MLRNETKQMALTVTKRLKEARRFAHCGACTLEVCEEVGSDVEVEHVGRLHVDGDAARSAAQRDGFIELCDDLPRLNQRLPALELPVVAEHLRAHCKRSVPPRVARGAGALRGGEIARRLERINTPEDIS